MEIRFYHLTQSPLERALPALLQKALKGGKRIVLTTTDKQSREDIDQGLWTWSADSFIPHGNASKHQDNAADHPIWVTDDATNNANNADTLILTGLSECVDFGHYQLCCKIFNGHDHSAVQQSRDLWKQYKEAGHSLTYWQQTAQGGWEQKA